MKQLDFILICRAFPAEFSRKAVLCFLLMYPVIVFGSYAELTSSEIFLKANKSLDYVQNLSLKYDFHEINDGRLIPFYADTTQSETPDTVQVINGGSNGENLSDTLLVSEPDSISGSSAIVQLLSKTLEDFRVYPLPMPVAPGARVSETDSTLRWTQFNEWSERITREPGVISYRLGGLSREDYHLVHGFAPTSQRYFLEGMRMQNPVTGYILHQHFALERTSKIQEYTPGLTMRNDMELQKFYVMRPQTRIYFDQGANQLRNTHAHFSQLLRRNWGYDLVYNGQNYAGEYLRAETKSRQMSARTFYHLNERYKVQAMVVYNGAQLQESGGYIIQDLPTFNFSRFFAPPVWNNAVSSTRHSQVQVALLRRARSGSGVSNGNGSHLSAPANARIMLYHDRYRRFFDATGDTTNYRVISNHAVAQYNINSRILNIQAELRAGHFYADESRSRSLSIVDWSTAEAELNALLKPLSVVTFPGSARIMTRSDGFQDWEITGGAQINLFDLIKVYGQLSVGETAPTIQQLYWQGNRIGNPDLETSFDTRTELGFSISPYGGLMEFGARGYISTQSKGVALLPDNTFSQLDNLSMYGGVLYADYTSESWEISVSTTIQQYDNNNTDIPSQFLSGSGLRIWNRGSVYWKGYMFNRAAFVKTGFYGIFSPNYYRPAQFLSSMGYWEPSLPVQEIPFFARLDFEASARVRYMFVLIRYENIAEGLGQFGYYEASPYPMPTRNLRFGLRVMFRN